MDKEGNKRLRNTTGNGSIDRISTLSQDILKNTNGNGSIDRISTLSQDIIHSHIFSRLDQKDIMMMSSLSNTWYRLSNSFPYLSFAEHITNNSINEFLSFVDQSLHRFHNLNSNQIIRAFSIPLKFQLETAPYLDTWINLVLQHGVENFRLSITNPPSESITCYNLPPTFFCHPNSITKVARLEGCSLLRSFLTSNPNPHPNFFLKTLLLCQILMNETVLSSIISCCPLIESLHISKCMGIDTCLRVSHLPRLKSLSIHDSCGDVEIDSPSLENLSLLGSFKVRIVGDYPILAYLTLFRIQELDLQELLSRLPLLHTLRLCYVYCLTNLKVSIHTLRKLVVKSCPNLVQLNIDDAPSLLSVKFTSDSGPPLDLVYSSSSAPCNVTLTFGYRFGTFQEFLFQLSNFVSRIKKLEILNLHLYMSLVNINLEELKRVVQPPVDRVHKLKVFFHGEMKENHLAVLDGLLWTCRPHTFSIPFGMNKNSNYNVENILEDIIMGHREGCHSFKHARSCWLHQIKDVMYVTKDGTETKLIVDATSEISNICSYIQSKNVTFSALTPYPEIKFNF